MIHDKGKLFPIVDPTARHFESKILTLKSLYSPACTTDAVLRKYGILGRDVQVLDHILTMEIKTHFTDIELAQTENYYGEHLRNQAS
jgi:hypothetical protein